MTVLDLSTEPGVPSMPTEPGLPGMKVTQLRVLASEWTKFRSLRSTLWTLLVTVALVVGLGSLFSWVTNRRFAELSPGRLASFSPVGTSLAGITFAQLAIGVLGVLMISGEYSTGMIRSSLMAVPSRLPVLWGKLAVLGLVSMVLSTVACVAAFLLGQHLLGVHGTSFSAPGAVRSVVGAALYLTVAGIIAIALGTLMRNTAGAIATFVGAFFLLPPLTLLLPSSISDAIDRYLPSNAGGALYGARSETTMLSPWVGFAVLCGYAVVLIALAALRLRRDDA